MRLLSSRAWGCLLVVAWAAGCGGGSGNADAGDLTPRPPHAIFVLPRAGDEPLFDLPWPSEVLRRPDGTVDFSRFPNPTRNMMVASYVRLCDEELDGFGLGSAAYLRFSEAIDPTTLPGAPSETLEPGATAFLLDVDPASPERGERVPARVAFVDGATQYFPARTLSMMPVLGFPLARGRLYAAVVTDSIRTTGGGPFVRDDDLIAIVAGGGDAVVEAARALYADALAAIDESGVPADEVLTFAVFRTQAEPIDELVRARDWIVAEYAAPDTNGDPALTGGTASYDLVEGTYGPSPIFQEGAIPYLAGGGAIRFDSAGDPIVADDFDARFALSVPTSPMPPNGYPIVLYAHGTGGDYRSFVGGVAGNLAAQGIAVFGIDQIHHGPRNPTTTAPELLVYNFFNPEAFRDNARQAALDVVQQARLVPRLTIPAATVSRSEDVVFDASQILFYGHSQGGTSGPIFLAIDDRARAGVLSGAGASITVALLEKTEPVDIPMVVRTFLGILSFEQEHFTIEHPIMTLLQTWMDAADPGNYVSMLFHEPRAGFDPKHILQTEGITDLHTPPPSMEALATAARIPLAGTVLQPIEGLTLRGLVPEILPVSDDVAGGTATAALLQFDGDHFVATSQAAARFQIASFLRSVVDGTPAIPAPP